MTLIERISKRFCNCPGPDPGLDPKSDLTVAERATYAKQLLANPLWQEIYGELTEEAFKVWIATDVGAVESREYLYKHIRALRQVAGRIHTYISNALIDEDVEIKHQKTRNPKETLGTGNKGGA